MKPKIFLSHNVEDKSFVRRLAADLEIQGAACWLDEAEMKIGDSLFEKIGNAISEVDYLAVILSPNSTQSRWVNKELEIALSREISDKCMKILPILYKDCTLPPFLAAKLYADFRNAKSYDEKFEQLIKSIGLVFNKNAHFARRPTGNLGRAIDGAMRMSLPILASPFHRPFQYMGMTIDKVAEITKHQPNRVGNIIIDDENCHMLLESEGNFISFVSADLKKSAPQYLTRPFDSEPALGSLSISLAELELARKQTHCHTYYDHRRRLKITVLCYEDGGPLCVSFSSKYYMM